MSFANPVLNFSLCLLVAAPLSVKAQIIFLDGGYAEYCSQAAQDTDDPEAMFITGSRLGLDPIEVCTRAINEGGENRAASFNNRGVLNFAMENYDAAIADFDQAIAIKGDFGQYHINKGLALVRVQRWDESIAAFDRGIALGGEKLDEAYYNRGVAREETGNISGAYYDYKRASELNPQWAVPREELSRFRVR